tara:strand:+ start:435 stop:782 length:348 start_codon:yes stop_codon:yes gene_type:complete
MSEFRFEVKYMLKMYYNLYIIKTMKKLLKADVEKKYGKESAEYELSRKDYEETTRCIKILKDMVITYYNIEDEAEIDKKISEFVKNDPYYVLTTKMANSFYKNIFENLPSNKEIN